MVESSNVHTPTDRNEEADSLAKGLFRNVLLVGNVTPFFEFLPSWIKMDLLP